MNALIAIKVLDVILLGMELLPEARAAAERLADDLRGFIDYDEDGKVTGVREPTVEEWNAINAETDSLLAELRELAGP
jgi:uncharacterized protein YuzE